MTDTFRFQVDSAEVEAALKAIPGKAHFGASMGLNRTANEIQDEIRGGLASRFTLRRADFVKKTIYRKPGEDFASKTNLKAAVRIHDDRNFLAKFEKGGRKTPISGKALAIPQGGVRRNKSDIVTKSQSVRSLIESGKAFVKGDAVFQRTGRGKKRRPILAYLFRRSVPIPASLGFEDVARRVADRRLEDNVGGAIALELSRGLTTKSGPSR
ncbi:MAG: hypothetical protein ABR551_14220 [Gemmatimonadales bacterium]